jgi:hypothetical protein
LKLPGADSVRIEDLKVHGYLLSPVHPVGRFKARVSAAAGFTKSNADTFVAEVRRIAESGDVEEVKDIEFGQKYTVSGELRGPAGGVRVLTVWILEPGQPAPRLVTVQPR